MGRARPRHCQGVYVLKTREVMQRAQGHPAGRTGGSWAGVGNRPSSSKSLRLGSSARSRGSWPRQAHSPVLEHSCVN